MRSAAEIVFRLRQEIANALLALRQPNAGHIVIPSPLALLPEPQRIASQLQGTEYARQVDETAREILNQQVPALGLKLTIGEDVRWRRDHVSGIETPARYFRRIPYLDPARVGDHKVIWELNRHQHLALLAQAYLLNPRPEYSAELRKQLESWMEANPFQYGINWTSALEVALRALSWIWIYHFAGHEWPADFQQRFFTVLYQHGLHLEYNLSVYFSPNTHLLGEALTLYSLGKLMPQMPRSRQWVKAGEYWVQREMMRQVHPDGGHFEQSTYYHVYATDMFLFFAILADPCKEYLERLDAMAVYLDQLMGTSRILPLLGDDDGGRLFHPYGARTSFGRGTLAAYGVFRNRLGYIGSREDLYPMAAWWLGQTVLNEKPAPNRRFLSTMFPQTGIVLLCKEDLQVLLDAGGFGDGSAGHSHSDTLSLVLRKGGDEILIDPGTYTYVGNVMWRNRFRSSAFHNTVRIDGQDQAIPGNPFSWRGRPEVTLNVYEHDAVEATCRYSGFEHKRTVRLESATRVEVIDEVSGPPGTHTLLWFWHFGIPAEEARNMIETDPQLESVWEEGGKYGWRSPVLGVREAAPVLLVEIKNTLLPVRYTTILNLL